MRDQVRWTWDTFVWPLDPLILILILNSQSCPLLIFSLLFRVVFHSCSGNFFAICLLYLSIIRVFELHIWNLWNTTTTKHINNNNEPIRGCGIKSPHLPIVSLLFQLFACSKYHVICGAESAEQQARCSAFFQLLLL